MRPTKNDNLKVISDLISQVPDNRKFIENSSEFISYGELKSLIKSFKKNHVFLEDQNCAITSNSAFHLSLYLPAICEISNNIYLEPENLENNNREEFYKKININFRIEIKGKRIYCKKVSDKKNKSLNKKKWILSTSGTSGTPKSLEYDFSSLIKTAKGKVEDGEKYIWGMSYELNRFAGLQVYLQAIYVGSSITIPDRNMPMNKIVSLFKKTKVSCLSGTPSYWRKLLMVKNASKINLSQITLGGEIADQSILDALKLKYKKANIIHIYASTEAGVGFSVKDGLSGFPKSLLRNNKKQSLQLKINKGLLWIKSDRGSNYSHNRDLTFDKEGFMNTGDLVELRDERVFFVGRDTGTINVGGNKVIPEEVEAIINSHKDVLISKVFAKQSSMVGMLVQGEIVVKPSSLKSTKKIKSEVLELCKKNLQDFKIPVILKFTENIDLNSAGKILRK